METDELVPLEYHVFSLAFNQSGVIKHLAEFLPPEAVGAAHGDTGLQEFYTAMLDFADKAQIDKVDPVVFSSWLEGETDIYDALGGYGGVKAFMGVINSVEPGELDAVVGTLLFRYRKRQQLDNLHELKMILDKKSVKSDKDIEQIRNLTDSIRALEDNLHYDPLDTVSTADDIAARADQLMQLPDFFSTPFPDLNKAMGYTEDGGFFRGAVHAIIAPSGKGKSTLAKCLVNHWVDSGYNALFINFEEAQSHWETILMTQILGENVYANADKWTDSEREEKINTFKDKMLSWGNRFMVRHNLDTSYFDDLDHWLRDIMGHSDVIPDIVVIDTIQSMISKGSGPRWEQFERMMIQLERLARDMNAAFIITGQQNAEAMKESREVVRQSDTGGSLAIVQKSSVVLFITEEKLAGHDDSQDDTVMQIQIPKNRITGSTYALKPPTIKYNDNNKSFEPFDMVNDSDYTNISISETILDDLKVFGGLGL